jgi:hypothetical protein
MGEGPLPYAALPGRIIAQQMLAASNPNRGLSLGLNLGCDAASAVILGPDDLRWLCEMLDAAPEVVQAVPVQFFAAQGLPEVLSQALTRTLIGAAGLAQAAMLAGVKYSDGRRGHMLAVIDALPEAQEALARALAEALRFSGVEAGALDVCFMAGSDAALARMAGVARVFDVPEREIERESEAQPARPAPGMDAGKPPILR